MKKRENYFFKIMSYAFLYSRAESVAGCVIILIEQDRVGLV